MLQASDIDQLSYSTREGRVLVTVDDDFLQLANTGVFHAGIVFCTARRRSIGSLAQSLIALERRTATSGMNNAIEFV